MAEKFICPYCKTPNQEGDTFCLNCGRPLTGVSTLVLPNMQIARIETALENDHLEKDGTIPGTLPLYKSQNFLPRPLKAVFGGQFLGKSLIHSDEQQHVYLVTELSKDDNNRIRQCSNPECSGIHVPLNGESESYCTICGSPLTSDHLILALFEARQPIFGNAFKMPEKLLTHAGIRVPVFAFDEKVAGEDRFCLVSPYTESLNATVEREQVFHWAKTLASAFDYLHHSGLTYHGKLGEEIFSLSNGNIVISGFFHIQIGEKVEEVARIADLQGLARVLFKWLTGRKKFEPDSGLSPALNNFFEKAINTPSFSTAETFAQAFTEAEEIYFHSKPIDHRLGRLTDVGIARSLNEDSLFTLQAHKFLESMPYPFGVYVVADGMGGHSAGEVASSTIVNSIAEKTFTSKLSITGMGTPEEYCKWIDKTILSANKAVYDQSRKMGSDMGSTIVMAVASGNSVCIGHVGDSRAYKIDNEKITQLTTDHSLVERLIDTGQITRDEARNHPQRNVIYRTMGDKENVEVATSSYSMNPGDRLLLCSDGLNGMLEDDVIRQIVLEEGITPQVACDRLVQAANAAGGEDNITVVVVEFV